MSVSSFENGAPGVPAPEVSLVFSDRDEIMRVTIRYCVS